MAEPFRYFVEPTEFVRNNLCFSDGMGEESNPSFLIDRSNFDNYLVMFVKEGILHHEQNGRHLRWGAGEYVFANLKQYHKYYFEPGVPSKIYWTHLNGRVVEEMANRIDEISPLPFSASSPQMEQWLKDTFRTVRDLTPDVFLLSQCLYAVVLAVLRDCREMQSRKEEPPERAEFVLRAQEALRGSVYRPVNLQNLAASVNMSKYHFCRMYHQCFGVSPMKHLMEEKIRTAKRHLLYTGDKIEVISQQLAFSSVSYFSKVFKSQVGVSPSRYREQMCNRHQQNP